jgi:hypothetical protein
MMEKASVTCRCMMAMNWWDPFGARDEEMIGCKRQCFLNWSAISQAAEDDCSSIGTFFNGVSRMILPEWTIAELQEKLESGELSSRRLAELYLARIQEVDKSGPYINSVIELNPEALEIADTLDAERNAGKHAAQCMGSRSYQR